MHEEISNFYKQLSYEPEIINQENFAKKSGFVIVGMGGSAHAALILKTWKPGLDIIIHRDYGLPEIPIAELKNKLIILSSYSGNTEEVVDAFHKAKEKGLSMTVVAAKGKLLELAKENNISHIELPDKKIQPRSALGFSTKAFLKFIGADDEIKKMSALSTALNMTDYEEAGKIFSGKMKNHIPVIYVSARNYSLAYIWKIKLNETGKIPAFCNVFPELNHNEMNGFSVLSDKFYFLILKDLADNPKILKRMEVTEKLYKDRGLKVEVLELSGGNIWQKIFSSLLLADWVSYHLALSYGLEPEQVPMVEEFKKLISVNRGG